jgi:dTDP-4-amino-4,6-dideoxygalactose transaminase
LRQLRQYGWRERDNSTQAGRNSRLDEIQAAVLRCALKDLEHWNDQRRVLALAYLNAFSGARIATPIRLPSLESHRHHVFHQFVVRVAVREQLRRVLEDHGVEYGIHYPRALSQQSAYKAYTGGRPFPVAERTAAEVLSLPMHPYLSENEIHYIVSALKDLHPYK